MNSTELPDDTRLAYLCAMLGLEHNARLFRELALLCLNAYEEDSNSFTELFVNDTCVVVIYINHNGISLVFYQRERNDLQRDRSKDLTVQRWLMQDCCRQEADEAARVVIEHMKLCCAPICCFCHEPCLPQSRRLKCIKCSNQFHDQCVVPWVTCKQTCPCCRARTVEMYSNY